MTMSQLYCFMAVAKHQNFSKAAENLHISQPAISKQVAKLEQELERPLIDRAHKAFVLTKAGEIFYQFLLNATDQYNQVLEEMRHVALSQDGTLNMGCLDGWELSDFYPKICGIFKERFPDICLSMGGYNHVHILDALERGEISVAITLDDSVPKHSHFSHRKITDVQAMLLTSALNPCAQKEMLSLADFKDEPFFVIAPDTGVEGSLEQNTQILCRAAGFVPNIVRVHSSASIMTRLQAGRGVRITCDWERTGSPDIFRFIPLDHALRVCAVWVDDDQNPAKYIFLNELFAMYQ